ncbi:YHS domain-containing protein [Pseudonocardia hierapolitana]|uniref:YHS domain-containing protein n=2 Tax=Pseudonocardia hierapolitana TaxID=1128676 RepID=A0A561SVK8_9PSEU|nr:YHS domain-containing protein [Pseudonocardia hierapolitana]
MTVEVLVTGRPLTADAERELADQILLALTTEESAPDAVLESARELVHVVVGQPGTWATGGPSPDGAPRYLVRLTVPRSWSNDRQFGRHIVPMVTEAIAATEPDPTRLYRDPHCVVQIVGLREHCLGTLGRATTSTEITRLMTRGYRESGERPAAPAGSTVDPICGMRVEWATARFTLTHDGVDYAFCAPSCRKVFAEDHAVA